MVESLLGGIGLTQLTVYQDTPGPDGIHAGCSHVHALTPEAYFGLSGEGAIELHDLEIGYRSVPLTKGKFIQFPPGTLHRSVSTDHLEVLAIMGNGGLAERGDARIYFGQTVDETSGEYERLRSLSNTGEAGAMERRDASARAYAELMKLWDTDKSAYRTELKRFIGVHQKSIASKSETFKKAIQTGPVASGEAALENVSILDGLAKISGFPIAGTRLNDNDVLFGMCGRLRPIQDLNPE